MEASALQAPAVLTPARAGIGVSFLRLRSDEQLVAMFRAGHEDAFRAIHDRYKGRLFAYARQMLPGRQDAEDALQDVFMRAYAGLRASNRELALRAWLYRVAHNRCIDELRRPAPPALDGVELRPTADDPVAQVDQRESLRRLIGDIRRLPDQQRSALLMRELGGMSYAEVADSLGISVAAVKSVLVRARVALVQAIEARDAACSEIRTALMLAHDRRMRPDARARRHMRDCAGCREFRRDVRGVGRQLAALAPALGPLGVIAKVLGIGGGAGTGAAAGGGTAAAGGAAGGATAAAAGGLLTTGHVATLLAATVVAAGGAVEIQHAIAGHGHVRHHVAARAPNRAADDAATIVASSPSRAADAPSPPPSHLPGPASAASRLSSKASSTTSAGAGSKASKSSTAISGIGSSDQLAGAPSTVGSPNGSGSPGGGPPGGTSGSSGSAGSGTGAGTGGSLGGGTGCGSGTPCTPGGPSSGPPSGSPPGGGQAPPQPGT